MRTLADCDADMLEGYLDGLRGEVSPGNNHSHSYRHGYANGADDRKTSPRAPASYNREIADIARAKDMSIN